MTKIDERAFKSLKQTGEEEAFARWCIEQYEAAKASQQPEQMIMTTKDTLTLLREVEAALEFYGNIKNYESRVVSAGCKCCSDIIGSVIDETENEIALEALPTIQELIRRESEPRYGVANVDEDGTVTIHPHLAPVASGWMPIATAPKDGTEVFVYVAGDSIYPTAARYLSKSYFKREYGDYEYMDEGWYWCFGYPSDFHECVIEPTHWMPLPQPPQAKGAGDE